MVRGRGTPWGEVEGGRGVEGRLPAARRPTGPRGGTAGATPAVVDAAAADVAAALRAAQAAAVAAVSAAPDVTATAVVLAERRRRPWWQRAATATVARTRSWWRPRPRRRPAASAPVAAALVLKAVPVGALGGKGRGGSSGLAADATTADCRLPRWRPWRQPPRQCRSQFSSPPGRTRVI